MKMADYVISQKHLKELIEYCPSTGVFTWRPRDGKNGFNSNFAGKRAGSISKHQKSDYSCIEIGINGKSYKAHHLAWLYMTGVFPDFQIDHDNRNSLDNRWENLKKSSYAKNTKNKSKLITNTSGVTGVHWSKQHNKWRAVGCVNYKKKHLGLFDDIEDAEKAVVAFRRLNGFHEDHGKTLAPYYRVEAQEITRDV